MPPAGFLCFKAFFASYRHVGSYVGSYVGSNLKYYERSRVLQLLFCSHHENVKQQKE